MYTSTLTQEDKQKYNIEVQNGERIMFQAYFRLYKKLEDATMQGHKLEQTQLQKLLTYLDQKLFDLGYLMTNAKPKMLVSKMILDDTDAFRCIDVGYVGE